MQGKKKLMCLTTGLTKSPLASQLYSNERHPVYLFNQRICMLVLFQALEEPVKVGSFSERLVSYQNCYTELQEKFACLTGS